MRNIASAVALVSIFGDISVQALVYPAVQPSVPDPVATTLPAPITPTVPAIPLIPVPSGPGGGPLLELKCGLPCTDSANCPSTCAQTMRTIENPPNSFTMECVATGACAQSAFTFLYSGGMTTYLESITAGAPYAFYGSTITVDNSGRATNLVVRTIECGSRLCAGATFRFLNADYGDIKCDEYNGCGSGCTVHMPPDAPVPCDQVSNRKTARCDFIVKPVLSRSCVWT